MDFPPNLPPIVYVPSASIGVPSGNEQVEYRVTKDGRKALLIYSAMDRLIAAMGPFQPWFACSLTDLDALWKQDKFDVVYLDIAVPQEHQRTPEPA